MLENTRELAYHASMFGNHHEKELGNKALDELRSFDLPTGNLAKEQQVRAAIRDQRYRIMEFLNDPNKIPNNKQDHLNLAYMLGTINALYGVIKLKPSSDLEKAVKAWESKV